MPASIFVQTPLTLLAGVAALVAGRFVTASIRPEATRLLALLVLGPLSPMAGAGLSAARKTVV
jgi:hypothetical protein